MRDHHDGRALVVEALKYLHYFLSVRSIEVPGRLVGEDERRARHDGPRDGDALLLTTRQLRRKVLSSVTDADLVHDLFDPLAPLFRADPMVQQGELDVLFDGQLVDQVEALKNEADVALADRR